MKKALKVTFGAIIAVGMVAPIQAHEEYFLNNTAVWVSGTYTKTSNNGASVGDVITNINSNNWFTPYDGHRPTFLDPEFQWDYALGARFHLPNSDSHLFISYDHFRNNHNRADAGLSNMMLPYQSNWQNFNTSNFANLNQRSDELRIGLDRALHFGQHFCIDLSAFFEYDRVVRNSWQTAQTTSGSLYAITRDTENRVRGYGPGVGAMGRVFPFNAAPNWSLFAGIMNTLLFAKEDFSDYWVATFSGSNFGLSIEPEQSEAVIGKIDINFGVEYSCHERNKFSWDVALGMRFMNMFNAFKNGNTMFQPPYADEWYGFAYSSNQPEDWGRWGPYLRFTIGGPNA